MSTEKFKRIPVEPIAPWEYIQDELNARRWTQEDLASVIQRSKRTVSRLLQGDSSITSDMAQCLAAAFGTDAQLWMSLQNSYELSKHAKDTREIEKLARIRSKVPVLEIVKRGWIKGSDQADKLEQEVCRFLRIGSITETPSMSLAAKKSATYAETTPSQLAWYFRVKELAEHAIAAEYRPDEFPNMVNELRRLAAYSEDARNVPKLLADFGVRLVFVQHLKGTKIDGVALWLDSDSPVVGMSLRFDRIDNFWHNLFHELVHIKYRDDSPIDEELDAAHSLDEIEQRANDEASDFLVNQDKLDSFIMRTRPLFYQARVVQFAQARNVHPGIVVGQLQRRGEIQYSHLRKLLEPVRSFAIGSAITDGWDNSVSFVE